MLMNFGMISFLNPEYAERMRKSRLAYYERLIERVPAQHWTESFAAPSTETVLSAATWEPFTLFDEAVDSPCGTWQYDTTVLQRAHNLDVKTHRGHKQICFDGDVEIPRVLERGKRGPLTLWMSYTPQEVLSQRPGLRKAKKHTIIAGLGMGWLLVRVLQKKTVKKVTLVERSRALVDWLLPALKARHDAPWEKLDVVVGDAYAEIPKLTADVALWDIWEMLGTADKWKREKIEKKCPNVKATWLWGEANWRD
jgi:hypothetical protein